jgi:hypothetical protein
MRKTVVVVAVLLGVAAGALGQGVPKALDAPDLWGKSYWTPGGPYQPGRVYEVKVTVENRGHATAYGTARRGYVVDWSLGTVIAGFPAAPHTLPAPYRWVEGMLLQGGRVTPTVDLRPGEAKEYTVKIKLPQDLKPGKYWLQVTVDPFNRVAEPQPHPNGEHDNISNIDIEVVR